MKKFLLKLFNKTTSSDPKDELRSLQSQFNKDALAIAKSYNIKLNFSDQSIVFVEEILGKIHDDYQKTNNDEGLRGIAIIFAFYIISTIEKNHGQGVVERNHSTFGENSFPFTWNEATIFPYAWCLKRIFDGASDNVATKYKVLILDNI